jgi:hypothetical protein
MATTTVTIVSGKCVKIQVQVSTLTKVKGEISTVKFIMHGCRNKIKYFKSIIHVDVSNPLQWSFPEEGIALNM